MSVVSDSALTNKTAVLSAEPGAEALKPEVNARSLW